jgi:pyruvate dehydrogenase E2 component (dihydrolipoamide acetyltransferase)
MAEAVRFQAQLSPEFERRYGARLVYDAMIAKACGLALVDHPTLNARWTDANPPAIEILTDVNVGVAVATDDGLVVVVLRGAHTRPLYQLSADLLRLAESAKSGRVTPDDVSGGTFTVTNLGAYGVEAFTPIINPQEAAILGVGAIARRPAVEGDAVVVREQMTLSLTFDHRVNDGAPAAAFLRRVREILEAPYVLLT